MLTVIIFISGTSYFNNVTHTQKNRLTQRRIHPNKILLFFKNDIEIHFIKNDIWNKY